MPELTPHERVHERLKKIRASKTVSLKASPFLRDEITGFDGKPTAFKLRYYQVQGIYHMLVLKRMVLGDDTGLGKTVETIGALCYLWGSTKEAGNKAIVISPKSAMRQWAGEIERFTVGIKPIVAGADKQKGESPVDARARAYREWAEPYKEGDPKKVLILNYALMVRDWDHGGFQPPKESGHPDHKKPVVAGLLDEATASVGKDLVVVFDEATAFKSMRTKTWEKASFLSLRAHRAYGLTATLLKNRLEEGYCIYRAIHPGAVFTTKTKFYDDFCYVELKKVRGGRRIPIVLGYKNLDRFRERIDPYFLGRKKHQVATELPALTTREIAVELSRPEDAKYGEALSGFLELGDGEVKDYDENKALVSLIYTQQVVNSLSLLKFEEGDEIDSGLAFDPETMKVGTLGSKEQALVDLFDGELDDEKVIVYTRFASLVPRLQAILKKQGIKSAAITGKISDKKRREAQKKFQDLESDLKVMFITAAGTEAINLQAAVATIFYDLPWSWGDYLQALGRMIRIGSPHQNVLAYHIIANRPNRSGPDSKTIDHHVLRRLRAKRNVIDKVLGEGAVGALKFDRGGSTLRDLYEQMVADAKGN